MNDGIGRKLAEELKQRAEARTRLEEAAAKKSNEQKASDEAALGSLAKRVQEEAAAFNQSVGALPALVLSRPDAHCPYELKGSKQINFSIEANKLQITIMPGHAPLFSNVRHGADGYTYLHIGPNGMATQRESTEDEIVESLLRQACGL